MGTSSSVDLIVNVGPPLSVSLLVNVSPSLSNSRFEFMVFIQLVYSS